MLAGGELQGQRSMQQGGVDAFLERDGFIASACKPQAGTLW